ncbi:MAG: site-specific DNA-methyltransferase, partial [Ignavibacteriaceae bacterium]
MDGKSLDILTDKLSKLKSIIPEAFTEDKIDWEKLKAALGDDINFENERYNLNWAGKSGAFNILQQRTSATLKPVPEESYPLSKKSPLGRGEGVGCDNIFIEGENLEVLKILQKSYFGKIKMIYIDPPYNTGNDSFIYPDKFSESKDEYLKRIGDKNEEGYLLKEGFFRKNSKDSGHYHSNWLSMMYPRLYIARNLLRDDGVIFVSIDDNEAHNLRMIMNEIFGEENFIADIIWEKRYGRSNDAKLMASQIDHIILYRKSDIVNVLREPRDKKSDKIYSNPDNDPRGKWASVSFVSQRTKEERPNLSYTITNPYTKEVIEHPNNSWKYSEEKYNEFLKDNRFYWFALNTDFQTAH